MPPNRREPPQITVLLDALPAEDAKVVRAVLANIEQAPIDLSALANRLEMTPAEVSRRMARSMLRIHHRHNSNDDWCDGE